MIEVIHDSEPTDMSETTGIYGDATDFPAELVTAAARYWGLPDGVPSTTRSRTDLDGGSYTLTGIRFGYAATMYRDADSHRIVIEHYDGSVGELLEDGEGWYQVKNIYRNETRPLPRA